MRIGHERTSIPRIQAQERVNIVHRTVIILPLLFEQPACADLAGQQLCPFHQANREGGQCCAGQKDG